MNDMRATISKNIRDFRKAAGYLQTDIAKRLDKAVTSVSSWEQGKSLPSADTLYELCSMFGRNINEMYGLEYTPLSWFDCEKEPPALNPLKHKVSTIYGRTAYLFRESNPVLVVTASGMPFLSRYIQEYDLNGEKTRAYYSVCSDPFHSGGLTGIDGELKSPSIWLPVPPLPTP